MKINIECTENERNDCKTVTRNFFGSPKETVLRRKSNYYRGHLFKQLSDNDVPLNIEKSLKEFYDNMSKVFHEYISETCSYWCEDMCGLEWNPKVGKDNDGKISDWRGRCISNIYKCRCM